MLDWLRKTFTKKQRRLLLLTAVGLGLWFWFTRKGQRVTLPGFTPTEPTPTGGNARVSSGAALIRHPDGYNEVVALDLPASSTAWLFNSIPAFKMPAGQTWVGWSGNKQERAALVNQWGFTHHEASWITGEAESLPGRAFGSAAAARDWLTNVTPAARLYGMAYDNFIKDDGAAKLPAFFNPDDQTVTAEQLANSIKLFLGNRADQYGDAIRNRFDAMALDWEGVPSTTYHLQRIRSAVRLVKADPRYAHIDFSLPDALEAGLYPNQSERFNILKDTMTLAQDIVPYVFLDLNNFNNNPDAASAGTAYWLYQLLKWVEIRQTSSYQPRYVAWASMLWANFSGSWGNAMHVRPDIMQDLPVWYTVSGVAKNRGGAIMWEDARPHFVGLDKFAAGMFRVGQLRELISDNGQYNVRLEFSTNNGLSWQTYDERAAYGGNLAAIDTHRVYQLNKPMVRGVLVPGYVIIAARKPTNLQSIERIQVRYNGRIVGIDLYPDKTNFGFIQL